MSLGLNGVYTTTAKIYLSPNSSDNVIRNFSFPLSDIFNPAVEARYRIMENLLIGLNIDYMYKVASGSKLTFLASDNSTLSVDAEDGFRFMPVELSLTYVLPFSTDKFKFLLGGGGGYYWGEHIRKISGSGVSNTERKIAYGIHVAISMDYLVYNDFIIKSEMKFRDPQFTVKSKYNDTRILYNGQFVRPPNESFNSKINVDGVTFIVGVAYQIF
ncbi:MAG: hypothetical protein IPM56_03925 [Ignavibacteriales bacterium]|nr:MAG: hypothetical protein IPM56_03925 [Ignavibacteriales bacterium]